ncbi:MAG: N-acetylmuramoyl-L-alanine amidase family protein [Chitinophagales bacterium]
MKAAQKILLIIGFLIFVTNTFSQVVKTIVVDAGHGGKDSGAIGKTGYLEKKLVLAVSLKVGKYIEENIENVKVIYTRESDEFIELHERANIANKNNADLFISIHANAAGSSSAHGTETFVLGLHKTGDNLDVAKRENSVIKYEENTDEHYKLDLSSPEGMIHLSMMQKAYLDQSIKLAEKVQSQFTERVQRQDRGVRQAGFVVLYKTTMPSILIELGFLTNADEEKFLKSEIGQDYMASAIYRAIKEYTEGMDKLYEEHKLILAEEEKKRKAEEAKKKPVFKIQLYASSRVATKKDKVYKDFKDVNVEQATNGIYRYLVNEYFDLEQAKKDLKKFEKIGYKGAYIVAYVNGERKQVVKL